MIQSFRFIVICNPPYTKIPMSIESPTLGMKGIKGSIHPITAYAAKVPIIKIIKKKTSSSLKDQLCVPIPHSPRDFSYSSMSLFTTSLNVRTLNSNLKSASLSYTSRCKRTCTYSFPFFGPPLVLGDMVYKIFFEYFNLPYSKFTQLIKSITLFRRCAC